MDILSIEFWTALATIVFIDLILAGDNAIVIGMAARTLPAEIQKKAILYGMVGAISIRAVATLLVVYLLQIPYLLAVGGALLIWIACKLVIQDKHDEGIKPGTSLWGAVRTIVIADAAMGLDNVIAIAGASGGHYVLVVIGMLISVPIIIWGSRLFILVMEKLPWILYLGAGVLAYTAAHMITTEPKLARLFNDNPAIIWTFIATIVVFVIVLGVWINTFKAHKEKARTARDADGL